MKKVSLLLMIFGAALLIYGGYSIWEMNYNEKQNLVEAKEIIKKSKENNEEKQLMNIDDFKPEKGDVVGILHLPSIEGELPIVEGTSEEELEEGVGHYSDTVYPGQQDQILLSGHRDTVFRRVGDMEIGDELIVELPYGTFTYEIESTEIVPADDTSVIKSTYPEEVLTLSTCYPFSYLGNAPDRYIIYAKPAK